MRAPCILCKGLEIIARGETRAQRGEVTCPRSHSTVGAGHNPAVLSSSLERLCLCPFVTWDLTFYLQGVGWEVVRAPRPIPHKGAWVGSGRSPSKMKEQAGAAGTLGTNTVRSASHSAFLPTSPSDRFLNVQGRTSHRKRGGGARKADQHCPGRPAERSALGHIRPRSPLLLHKEPRDTCASQQAAHLGTAPSHHTEDHRAPDGRPPESPRV